MNRPRIRHGYLLAAIVLWAGLSVPAYPAASGSAKAVPDSLTIHYIEAAPAAQRTANKVLAYFTVLDEEGSPLLDVPQERFDALQDGKPIDVQQIVISSDPMAVVLAIDTSGSMLAETSPGVRAIDTVKQAAITFLSLLSEGDRVALFTFGNETELRLDFTADRQEAINAVRRISATPRAFTRLYDTALEAVKKAAEVPRGRRAVILLTDGKDEKSGGQPFSVATVRDVIDAASTRAIRVPIYTLGAGPKVDADALGRMAALTGGKSLVAASAAQVAALYRTVADQLKHPYRLTFFSRSPSGEHSLVVKCRIAAGAVQDERRFWSPPLPVHAPPTVAVVSPDPGSSIPEDPTVRLRVTPEQQVAKIRAYLDGRLIVDKDQPPLDRFVLPTDRLAPGRHLLRVEALNASGAMGAAEVPVTVPAPSVGIVEPDPARPVHGRITLGLRIESENAVERLRLYVDGVVVSESDRPPFESIGWDTASLAPGGHTVRVEAVDEYGRSGTGKAFFHVNPPPWKRLLPLAAAIAVAGAALLGYLLHRHRAKKPEGEGAAVPGPCAPQAADIPSDSRQDEDETVFFDKSIEPKTAPAATLTVLESPGLEPATAFEVQGAASVGRHEKSDVRLVDKSVSRKHAEIYFDGTSYFLRDLGSRYGTTVNRHRIALDAAPLFDGAQIKLGARSTLEFSLPGPGQEDDATLVNLSGEAEDDDTFPVDR